MGRRRSSDTGDPRGKRGSTASKDGTPIEIRATAAKKMPPSPAIAATKVPASPSTSASEPDEGSITDEARSLWEGWRGMEEYAREVFPIEEENNGLDWMASTSSV